MILSRLRQLPAFWEAQQQPRWEPATKQLIQTGDPDVGPLDDLEVPRPSCLLLLTASRIKKPNTKS